MNDRLLTSMAVLLSSYVASSMLVFPVRALAIRLGVLDFPGGRKAHAEPVPLLGGMAIFGSLLLVIGGSLWLLGNLQDTWIEAYLYPGLREVLLYVRIAPKLWALLAGTTLITLIGIADDVRGVNFPPLLKFAGQFVAALILLRAGIYMDLLNCDPYLSMIISAVWIVGITNSFNLLDNMNGLSSGIAVICSSVFLILVLAKGEFFIGLLLSALIGSILGFYQFNMRGRIFLGDTGSLLIGYLLGAVSLMARYVGPGDESIFPVLAPVMILGLPLFDTFSVILIRLNEGRPVFQGDQRHLSHRLVRIGMNQSQSVYFNYLMAFSIAATALFMIRSSLLQSILAVVQVLSLVAMVSILMTTRARNGSHLSRQGEASNGETSGRDPEEGCDPSGYDPILPHQALGDQLPGHDVRRRRAGEGADTHAVPSHAVHDHFD